jgi:hypothetical protein
MIEEPQNERQQLLTDLMTMTAILIAVVAFALMVAPMAGMRFAFGNGRLLAIALTLIWLLCVTLVIRRQRRWWLLLTAIPVLGPWLMPTPLFAA